MIRATDLHLFSYVPQHAVNHLEQGRKGAALAVV